MNKLVPGFFLGVAFILVFAAILMLLSSLELQSAALETQFTQKTPTTLGSIKNSVNLLTALQKQDEKRTADRTRLLADNQKYSSQIQETSQQIANDGKDIVRQIRVVISAHKDAPKLNTVPLPSMQSKDANPVNVDDVLEAYFVQLQALAPSVDSGDADSISPAIADLRNATSKTIDKFTSDWDSHATAVHNADNVSAQLAALANPPPDPTELKDPAYKSLVEDFWENQWLFGSFAFIPHTMLVLLLALFMGMLGSLIQLALELLDGKVVRTIGEMSFRIGLGAAVALALFCFAAAGVLAMAAGEQPKTNMSPYLISFLGITAGYLSVRVTAWMREVGEQTFKLTNVEQPDRWAVGLDATMQAQTVTAAVIGPVVGEKPSDIEEWARLDKAVPPRAQLSLSHYLHVSRSKLFTDLDPHTS